MGYAVVGNCFDYTALYWNPAALVFMDNIMLGTSVTRLPADISQTYFAVGGPANIRQKLGVGLHVLTEGSDIEEYNTFGTRTGTKNYRNLLLSPALAFRVNESLSVASSIGMVTLTLGDYTSATAVNANVGFLYVRKRLSAGMTVMNMGSQIEFEGDNGKPLGPAQSQPQLMRAGAAYTLLAEENLTLAYSLQKVDNYSSADWSAFGLEYTPWKFFALRLGTRSYSGLTVPSLGFGFNYKRIAFDVSQTAAASSLEGTDVTRADFQFTFGRMRHPVNKKKRDPFADLPPSLRRSIAARQAQDADASMKVEVSTIALADFTGKNVSQTDASVISDFLRYELSGTGAFRVIEKAAMDKQLAALSFKTENFTALEGALVMGKILNVKYMLVGSFSKLLDVYHVSVLVVEVETGRTVRTFSQEASSARELRDDCKELAEKIARSRLK